MTPPPDLRSGHLDNAPVVDVLRAPAWVISLGLAGVVTYVMMFVVGVLSANVNVLQACTVAPLLVLFTVPIAVHLARLEHDRGIAGIIMAALVAKLLGSLIRYYVAFEVYSGVADATQYAEYGRELAPRIHSWNFDFDVGKFVGTGFTRILTGFVYAIFGASTLGGFLVFSWLAFLGLVLFWRAFRVGVPDGDSRRYLVLVLLLPSLLYWPSSIGKEAWMMLAVGVCAYGLACLFQRRPHGAVIFSLGLFATTIMRPHVALVIFVGIVFAMVVRRGGAHSYLVPLMRILGLGVLLVLGIYLAGQTASFLGADSLTTESVETELSETEVQTGEGGSQFTPVRVRTPLDLPAAAVTVFFRPFPHEAGSTQGLFTAGEGLVLFVLCVTSRKRLRAIPQRVRSTPYVAFAVGYVVAFVYAFSSFGNFGILARQRVQALPLVLVVLAIPPYRPPATKKPKGKLTITYGRRWATH